MANFYALPTLTTWSATGNTGWSATSGGANSATAPGQFDVAIFDANSGGARNIAIDNANPPTIAGLTATASNVMTFTGTQVINVRGGAGGIVNLTKIASMPAMTMESGTVVLNLSSCIIGSLIMNVSTSLSGNTDVNNTSVVSIGPLGALTTNGWQMACTRVTINGTVNMGSSIWCLNGLTGVVWTAVTGCTINAGTSTILLRYYSATTRIFAGGGKTYYNVTHQGDFSIIQITGANTFSTYTGQVLSITEFQAGLTQTATSFSFDGTSQIPLTVIRSTTPGSAATLFGNVTGGYRRCNIQDISMSSGATNAYDSVNSSNCSNIIFRPSQRNLLTFF